MKVILAGREGRELLPLLAARDMEITEDPAQADVCLCYGGDGTLIGAVRDYPALPLIPIRRDSGTIKCSRHADAAVLDRLKRREHTVTALPLLQAQTRHYTLFAVNEALIHNQVLTSAVRFRLRVDGREPFGEIVGDGVVVATPFGSSAYYRSITGSALQVGIGVAFNNSTEAVSHVVLGPDRVIDVRMTRGPALLVVDNNPLQVPLIDGDEVSFRMSSQAASIWDIENLLCRECRLRDSGKPAGHQHVC